jgi:hypothetical protein
MRWEDLMKGPSRAEVRRHIKKLANYRSFVKATAKSREL